MTLEIFLKAWVDGLNTDEEIRSRLVPFKSFAGGPCPVPGPGPYPRPTFAYDPYRWHSAKGYSAPKLDDRELIELRIIDGSTYTLELKKSVFVLRKSKSKDPCISISMGLDSFKSLITGKHRILWVLSDPSVELKCADGIAHSDWITILELLAKAQELPEEDISLWNLVERI